MNENRSQLVMYADYVCPFCYLEHRSLRRYTETRENDRKIDVDWHPYDLRSERRGPDGDLDERDLRYPERVGERIEELKREHGAEGMLTVSEVPRVDSLNAQVASLFVASEYPDRWAAFDDGVFAALWRDGRDISDIETVTEIAERAGVDENEIRSAVADDGLRSRLFECFAEARQNGVTDVPTLVYDGHTIRDVVSPEELERLVRDR